MLSSNPFNSTVYFSAQYKTFLRNDRIFYVHSDKPLELIWNTALLGWVITADTDSLLHRMDVPKIREGTSDWLHFKKV